MATNAPLVSGTRSMLNFMNCFSFQARLEEGKRCFIFSVRFQGDVLFQISDFGLVWPLQWRVVLVNAWRVQSIASVKV